MDVSVSRAHGFVVIGDWTVVRRVPAWKAFMEQAQKETDIVAPDFLDIGMEGSRHDDEGKLVDKDGMRARLRQYVRSEGGSNHGGQCGRGSSLGSTFLISLLFRCCWLWCAPV